MIRHSKQVTLGKDALYICNAGIETLILKVKIIFNS